MKPIFPSIGYSRLRMEVDGEGVTTLVCAQGCPLRCKYCINPESSRDRGRPRYIFTPESLYEAVKIDSLYFLATGGGIMFGGGEPLLYPDFIEEFAKLAPDWKLYCETSLWVSPRAVERAAQIVDHFAVDIKETDPEIYRSYTGRPFDRAGENLRLLLSLVGADRITVRLPLIPGYNTDAHRDRSEALLREWGVTRFDRFNYVIKEKNR
ncbi:MAG: radical SAM protein [Clostridia bacterium]|nr:radical SAM protein [Clostridia bacterium]